VLRFKDDGKITAPYGYTDFNSGRFWLYPNFPPIHSRNIADDQGNPEGSLYVTPKVEFTALVHYLAELSLPSSRDHLYPILVSYRSVQHHTERIKIKGEPDG
jgi:hypothetical protein